MQDPSLSNSSLDVLNISVTNQEELEKFIVISFDVGIQNFNPSPECEMALRLLGCLHFFAPCDSNMSVLAIGTLCREVRDMVCEREWMAIDEFLGPGGLPVCEEFPEGSTSE